MSEIETVQVRSDSVTGAREFTGAWHAGWPNRRTTPGVPKGTAAAAEDGDANWTKHYLWDTAVRN